MAGKMKFNPIISRVKLNPEQAVLTCTCVRGRYVTRTSRTTRATICRGRSVRTTSTAYCSGSATSNFT